MPQTSTAEPESPAPRDRGFPILLDIDVEPDGVDFDPHGEVPWHGFEAALEWLPRVRDRLAGLTGEPVRLVWLVRCDPQLAHTYGDPAWAFHRYRSGLDALRAAGDEIGVHIHMFRWQADARCWLTDFADPVWIRHCLEMAVEGMRRATGLSPLSMSSGINWMSTDLANAARRLGLRHDFTCVARRTHRPHGPQHGRVVGDAPDFSALPDHPYSPSHDDFRRRADLPDGFWIVPLSAALSGHPRADAAQPWYDRMHIRLGPEAIAPAVEEHMRRPRPRQLVLSLRSSAFLAADDRDRIEASLAMLAGIDGARFVDAAGLVEASAGTRAVPT